jgi:propanediol dehydratase large subunit
MNKKIEDMKRIAILAGNKEQFFNFMSQPEIGEPCEYIYIDRIEKLIGNRFYDYKIIGTFWEREGIDLNRLVEEVKSRII